MATSINVGINVSSNGTTDQETKKVKGLKDMLDGAEASAKRASRALSQASTPAGTRSGSRAQEASMSSAQLVEYNRGRGTAGGTGASARDFSNQAQGLGGLVRIYATLAANIFAASAAFGALSRALDTTNMIKGLDQLGAASGTALGSLSQRLVLATDGAVSLREAMEATVKASSAGLNSDQILKMGQVAKQASLALGVNMTDALSRISRGVTKLEPELLDELGLFVKIDDAVNKYALSVGKNASQLTNFERRQAFANEVLDQGIKKFGEIDLQSNSYSRLAAQLSNLAQSGLELVNKFLTPVANILADNTGLLVGVLAVLGTKILKMAIPALGEWKKSLVSAAEAAKKSADEINISFAEYTVEGWEKKLGIPDLKKSVKTAETELKTLASARPSSLTDKVSQTDLSDQKQLSTLLRSRTASLADHKKKLDALGDSNTKQAREQKKIHRDAIDYLNKEIAKTKELQTARRGLDVGLGQLAQQDVITPGSFDEKIRARIAKGANENSKALTALSQVSKNTMEIGMVGAIQKLNSALEGNVNYFRRWATVSAGAIVGVATSLGLAFQAFSGWLAVGGIAVTGVVGIINYFSTSKKEAELAGEAFDRTEGAIKNVATTLERLQKIKDPLAQISTEAIVARANAFEELGTSIDSAVTRGFKQLGAMNWGDRLLDNISSLWGGDVKTKIAKNLSDSITAAFNGLAENTETVTAARQSIATIVGADIDNTEFKKKLGDLVGSGDQAKIEDLAKVLQKVGTEAKVSASKLTELKQSFDGINTTFQEFNRSLLPTDNLFKLGTQGVEAVRKLDMALQDPVSSLNAMRDLLQNTNVLSLFPPEVARSLLDQKQAVESLSSSYAAARKTLTEYKEEDIQKQIQSKLASLKVAEDLNKQAAAIAGQTIDKLLAGDPKNDITKSVRSRQKSIENFKKEISDLEKTILNIKQAETVVIDFDAKIPNLQKTFKDAVGPALESSADLAATRLAAEIEKAKAVVPTLLAGFIGDTAAGVNLRADLEKQAIEAEKQTLQATFNLTLSMQELSAQVELDRLSREQNQLSQFGGTENEIARLGTRIGELTQKIGLIGDLRTGKSVTSATYAPQPEMFGLAQLGEGFRSKLDLENQKLVSVELKKQYDLVKVTNQDFEKQQALTQQNLTNQKSILSVLASGGGLRSQQLQAAEESNSLQSRTLANSRELKKVDQEIEVLTRTKTELIKVGKKDIAEELQTSIDLLNFTRARTVESQKQTALVENLNKAEQKIRDNAARQLLDLQAASRTEDNRLTVREQELAAQAQILDLWKSSGKLGEIGYAFRKKEADELQRNLEFQRGIFTLNQQFQDRFQSAGVAVQVARNRADQLGSAPDELGNLSPAQAAAQGQLREAEAAQARLNQEYSAAAEILTRIFGIKTATAGIVDREAQRQAEIAEILRTQEDAMNRVTSAAKGLGDAFGETGSRIESFLTGLVENTNKNADARRKIEEDYAKDVSNIRSKFNDESEEYMAADFIAKEKRTSAIKAIDMEETASRIQNLRKSTKEGTVANKALMAIEKVYHLQKLAFWAKDKVIAAWKIAMNFKEAVSAAVAEKMKTTAANAGFLARAGTYVTEIFAKFTQMMGPWGLVAAAAAVAAIGLSGKKPSFTMSAEQRQETQGTGQTYDSSGNLVNTGSGVLGDPTQKLDSIRLSLQKIQETSVDGLDYSNKMVSILESIDKGINKTATFLYTIPGVIGGSAFGTTADKSGGGFLSNLVSGIFGKTSTTILDQGIKLEGSFRQLAGAVSGGVTSLFETVQKKTSYLFGLISSTSIKTQLDSTSKDAQDINKYINTVFSGFLDLFSELGGNIGISANEVNTILDNLGDVGEQISTKDLKGDELVSELNAVLSSIVLKGSEALFGFYKDFQKFGEDLTQTVIRVQDETIKSSQQLKNVGLINTSFLNLNPKTVTTITQGLIEASGGFDKFLESTEFFRDNFLNLAEKLKPTSEALDRVLVKYGLTLTSTLDQFEQAVQSIDVTTDFGQKAFGELMLVAEDFYKVTQKLTELRKTTASLETDLLKAKGYTEQYKQALRAQETEGFTPAEIAVYDYNQALRDQITALEDARKNIGSLGSEVEKLVDTVANKLSAAETAQSNIDSIRLKATQKYVDAQNNLATVQERLNELAYQASDNLQNLAKTLRNFGSESTKSIEQQFKETLQKALGGDETALGELSGLATQAIDSAKEGASSLSDFETRRRKILVGIEQAAAAAESKATQTLQSAGLLGVEKLTEEQKLQQEYVKATQALTDITSVLNTIGAGLTLPVEDLVSEYNAAVLALETANEETATAIGELKAAVSSLTFAITTDLIGYLSSTSAPDTKEGKGLDKDTFTSYFAGSASRNVLENVFDALDSDGSGIITNLEAIKGNTGTLDWSTFKSYFDGSSNGSTMDKVYRALNDPSENLISKLEEIRINTASTAEKLGSNLAAGTPATGYTQLQFREALQKESVAQGLPGNLFTQERSNQLFTQLDTNNDQRLMGSEITSSSISDAVAGAKEERQGTIANIASTISALSKKSDQAQAVLDQSMDYPELYDKFKSKLDVVTSGTSSGKIDAADVSRFKVDEKAAYDEEVSRILGSITSNGTFKTQYDAFIQAKNVAANQPYIQDVERALLGNLDLDYSGSIAYNDKAVYDTYLSQADRATIAIGASGYTKDIYPSMLLTMDELKQEVGHSIENTTNLNTKYADWILSNRLDSKLQEYFGTSTGPISINTWNAGKDALASWLFNEVAVASGASSRGGIAKKDVWNSSGTTLDYFLSTSSTRGVMRGDGEAQEVFYEIDPRNYGKYSDKIPGNLVQRTSYSLPSAYYLNPNNPQRGVPFAQGGVFTNGLVDSPTMFPLGVMGEAGPEAIMPLTRGPGGNLGVVAHGGSEEMEKLMKELVKEVQYLRSEVRSDVTHNAKTARLLDRVIPGGDSLVVTASIDGGKI